jgi:hypothetical protein
MFGYWLSAIREASTRSESLDKAAFLRFARLSHERVLPGLLANRPDESPFGGNGDSLGPAHGV